MARRLAFAAGLAGFIAAGDALAQNTASIPAAAVNKGDILIEYRAGYGVNGGGADDIFSQRLHANYAPTDDIRLMAFIEQRQAGDGPYKWRRLSPNIFTQVVESDRWDLAVRWQGDIPLQEGVPGRARLGLLNTWRFSDLELRSNIYFGREIGDNAPGGFVFETREEASLRIRPKVQVGAQVFNNFVTTKNFGDFDRQRHQAGPFLRTRIGKAVRVEASVLFGVSAASPDVEPRLFAGYSF